MSDAAEKKQTNVVVLQKKDIASWENASWDDMRRMASEMAASELLPIHLRQKPANLLIILQTAKELGIGPLQGIDSVDVIQGKRSIKPEAQVALIRAKVPESFISFKQDDVKREFSCTMAPSRHRMDEAFTSTWNPERAKKMGLLGKDNYVKQEMTMFKWRAIGDCARTVFPHVTKGIYNSVEATDIDLESANSKPKLKDIFSKPISVEDNGEPSGIEIDIKQDNEVAIEAVGDGVQESNKETNAAKSGKDFF